MKAIITDLDRTLLRTDKSVSERTKAALARCREKGIYVLAASARPIRDLHEFDRIIGFDAMVAGNGAVVSLPGRVLDFGIKRESGEQVISRILKFPDVLLSIETDRGLFSNADIPEWQPIVYGGFPALPKNMTLYKILVSSPARALYEGIADTLTPDVYHTVANGDLIQIMSREATKWNGVSHMLSYFGISPADAVYFGDDNDDLEPIKNCGLGVAVSNAIPAVLVAADQITSGNDEDGVAAFIETYIL